jgi:outer membrane protein TolC
MTAFKISRFAGAASALVLATTLGACAVGPDYHRPDLALTSAFHAPPPGASAGARTTTIDAWWTGFGDQQLVTVVQRAAAQNLDLAQARARLVQSR